MLSKKTKYGLKALIYIAKKNDSNPVNISEIAQSENISVKFLESILLSLKKTGFLGSKLGKDGGYYLLKEPSEIPMSSIIRFLEGPIALLPCASLNFYEKCEDCPDEEYCKIHKFITKVRDKTLEIFKNNSLKDLIT